MWQKVLIAVLPILFLSGTLSASVAEPPKGGDTVELSKETFVTVKFDPITCGAPNTGLYGSTKETATCSSKLTITYKITPNGPTFKGTYIIQDTSHFEDNARAEATQKVGDEINRRTTSLKLLREVQPMKADDGSVICFKTKIFADVETDDGKFERLSEPKPILTSCKLD